ncbi:ribonuclease P protein subunit p25-like [Clupea harengus]|uniref:Ribonuclease P protein subunit p25-like n=1 Tax=Clupea harengus TaxID=7950 RepID=A0A6P3W135_CLUHA|nr:ribonuclease P protein subunit p25-like [Clupea harengus]
MIAGFSGVNGHISGQCHVAGSSGLLAAPQVPTQAPTEPRVTPNLCFHFQGRHFDAHPQSTSAAARGLTPSAEPTPPPPPPPPPALPPPQPSPAVMPTPGQGGFKKVCRTEEASPCPFPGLAAGVLQMRVKEGSKIRNLMGFAMARMQGPSGADALRLAGGTGTTGGSAAGLRQVVFSGSGRAVTKTITCAEIMKRKLGGLHQLTKLCYKGVKEVWESQEPGGSEMTVHRTVPSISILLSKDPLDPHEPGYQPPETLSALWGEREEQSPPQTAPKRPPSLELLAHADPSSAKRLCGGARASLGCPVD